MRNGLVLSLCAALLMVGVSADASVTQVDGTILPVTGACQTFLNAEEGFSPPSTQAINALVDAEQLPDVFLPDTMSVVTFKDVGEGAGFENSFGYYNVGDDVTVMSNLHPILGCGVSAATHTSEAAGYFVNAEPGNSTTVNFATEATALRYKGGFIGFYLITPEGHPGGGADNCGDFAGAAGTRFFGRIYFTQRDLNNDGDFVHSLVFQSNVTGFPDRFYFGFEDLFRGGDNDFEDMLIKVDGLTPPCLPVAETCNGQDDDCDGTADNAPLGIGSACTSGIGACLTSGTTICTGGAVVCGATPGTPTAELCNNIDDDCDGVKDDSPTDVNDACSVGIGTCAASGVTVCNGGFEICGVSPGVPGAEQCNALDDDCDTLVDEDFGIGLACDGVGACGPGVIECNGPAGTRCSTDVGGSMSGATPELCNGIDDDCDGSIDEGAGGVGLACTTGAGACLRTGFTICAGGAPVCGVVPGAPQVELCDGIDNDCDGAADEDFGVGLACDGVGECGLGTIECRTTLTTGCSTDVGGSMDESSPESCDTLDNDCDGSSDEGLSDVGPCGLTNVGECADGRLRCSGGVITCVGAILPTPEFCDNLDNDCNGAIDDSVVDDGNFCGDDTGECNFGLEVCVGGTLTCLGGSGPTSETCNDLDDDCDGVVDDSPIDVGLVCGASDVGECNLGLTICVAGTIQCNGEIGPSAEICDGLDNDCNGLIDDMPVDVGGPCGIMVGICMPGVVVCLMGAPVCQGGVGGVPEICNGFDDDCNGFVDDMLTDVGGPCGMGGLGICTPGMEVCIAGMIECVGGVGPTTETCNGLDDDCDGMTDEGDLCSGGVCMDGGCAIPCQPGELPCAPGFLCVDEFCVLDECFGVSCPAGPGGELEVCDQADGSCVPACSLVVCSGGFVCRDSDGLCVPDNCTFLPEKCVGGELCVGGACVTDLCAAVSCPPDEFCRPTEGTCVASCGGVACAPTEDCHNGVCEPTGCTTKCDQGSKCVAGACVDDPCRNASCNAGEACDPDTGDCVADPCTGITCPTGQECHFGDCFNPGDLTGQPDAGPKVGVYATGGGGCSVGGSGGNGGAGAGAAGLGGAALLLLVAFSLRRWRLAGRLRHGALLALLVLLVGACDVEPFYFTDDAGNGGPDADPTQPDARVDAGGGGPDAGCVLCAPELCNEVDDDCDLEIDEGFNLLTDETNCGMCGVTCAKTGSISECQTGACAITGCFPGFVDLNGDIGGPFDTSDGCEYGCFVSNMGVEACDTLDNDCDGAVDEDTAFDTDDVNCGSCGHVCAFFQANASCSAGLCGFDPLLDCNPGFSDVNGNPADGCEYACTQTNGGVEACDAVDNDCNGMVDEIFGLGTDPTNCGLCGRVCAFPNVSAPSCALGACVFDPALDCDAGFVDADGTQLDGCEYACTQTNGGVEICDGLDNDCDAEVDDDVEVAANDPAIGVSCGAPDVGECNSGLTQCVGGGPTCVGALGPHLELCNGLDDDCDGTSDEVADLIDVGHICAPSIGQCSFGLTVCGGGALSCVSDVGPSAEVCDLIDNDCNGVVDDTPVDVGMVCGGGAVNGGTSQCVTGLTACTLGVLGCAGSIGPSAETCDGVDEDCDGTVDDAALLVGTACGSDVGECNQGTFSCTAGALVCGGGSGALPEICDGLDNDCSGLPDDNLTAISDPRIGLPCGITAIGSCDLGAQICSGGAIVCNGAIGPSGEACNGADDDCDGATDENAAGMPLARVCYTGASGTNGIGLCHGGNQTCAGGAFGACVGELLPATESCNTLDDDCDGVADEAAAGGPLTLACYGGPGGTLGVGICAGGTSTCASGAFGACVGQVLPNAEICGNGLNDDCDTNVTDASEQCFAAVGAGDFRVDSITGSGTTSTAGQHHSFDASMATSGANVYIAFSDNRNGGGTPNIYLARSTDGGATFLTPLTRVASSGSKQTAPHVLVVGTTVIVQYIQIRANLTRDVFVAISVDSGATFAAGRVVRQDLDNDTQDAFHVDVAAVLSGANVKVAVAWEELDTGTLSRVVKVRRTMNAGAAATVWDAVQTANKGAGVQIAGRPKLVYGNSDRIVVVWREQRSGAGFNGTTDIFRNFWNDASGSINATDLRIDSDGGLDSDDLPVIARLGAEIYVAWEDFKSDGADITFRRSLDSGTTFLVEQVLDDPTGGEVSSSLEPSIAALTVGAENRVFVSWIDDRDGTEIFVARSIDGGALFSGGVRVSSDVNPSPGVSQQHSITTDATGRVAVVFTSNRNGNEDIFVGFSLDAGVTWQPIDVRSDSDVAGAGISVDPVAALRPAGGVNIAWVDYRTNGVQGDIYFRAVSP